MDRLRLIFFAALLIGVTLLMPSANAQTASGMTVLSGNGQITCPTCVTGNFRFFLPMVVKVTDSNGNAIPNKTVNWNVTNSQGSVPQFTQGGTTTTDGTGVTSNTIIQSTQTGSFAQPFLQSTIVASADSAAVTFVETLALTDPLNTNLRFIQAVVNSPSQGTTLTGTANSPGSSPVTVHVDAFGLNVANASVRLVNNNDPNVGASAACQTGPGADPGSVLTDGNGNATCVPIFGAITGQGAFSVLIGGIKGSVASDGVSPGLTGTTTDIGYFQSFVIPIVVQGLAPGTITVSSGTAQSAGPGQALANPLVARVADSTGANPVANVAVAWTVSPAGAATVNPPTSSSNAQGLASTAVTLSNTASGQVTVKASLTGANSNISTTFTINVVIPIIVTGFTKLPGADNQTAIIGNNFAQPVGVVVNTSSGTASNFPVTFTVSGPASINGQTSSVVNTDSTGTAHVTLTAGSTTGPVTVTVTGGGQTATFSLTVIPKGPSLTPNSFFNAAGLKPGSLSPCSLAVISATGLAPGVTGSLDPPSLYGPYPLTLGPVAVTFNGVRAPIVRVTNSGGQESVIVQVPCEVTPGSSVPVAANVSGGTATTNVAVPIVSPGIFETPMSDGVARAVTVRPDGSFVSLENPARRGEVIRVYCTGLGATAPAVGTNSIPIPGTDSLVLGQVIVGVNNSGARVISARWAPTQIGIYEVAFQVDPNAPVGNNVVLSVAINPTDGSATQFSNGSKIPIQ